MAFGAPPGSFCKHTPKLPPSPTATEPTYHRPQGLCAPEETQQHLYSRAPTGLSGPGSSYSSLESSFVRPLSLARSLRVRRQRPRNLFCGERLEVGHHLDQFPGNWVTRVAGAGTAGPSLGESRGGGCCWARRSRPTNAALKCGQKPTSKGERRQERGLCGPRL